MEPHGRSALRKHTTELTATHETKRGARGERFSASQFICHD